METIQNIFKDLLRVKIAPRLRESGIKGSGQNYHLNSDSHWALIGIQKSIYSTSEGLEFTINLFVVSREIWDAERKKHSYFPEKPTANAHWFIGWHMRIGRLLPGGQDHWWHLSQETNLENLSEEILDVIFTKAVPAIRKQTLNV